MEFTEPGACLMVKNIFVLLMSLISFSAYAGFIAGVSTNSWQEKVPVLVSKVQTDQLTSFSSIGVNIGYDYLYSSRVRYAITASYLPGRADIHKLDNADSPRRNFNSAWLTNKLHWRTTKTFSYGPSLVLNYRKLDGLDAAMSAGGFLDLDFDLTDEVRLTQSLGTMSDSRQLAYSFTLVRKF